LLHFTRRKKHKFDCGKIIKISIFIKEITRKELPDNLMGNFCSACIKKKKKVKSPEGRGGGEGE